MSRRPLALILAGPACVACALGPAETGDGAWEGTIETAGFTTTVHTELGSVWGGPAALVEEASVGVDEGDDAYMLGSVADLTVGNDLIYVIDRQVPVIRTYSLQGEHRGDLGRAGQGPGEYQRPSSVRVDAHGRVYVRDVNAQRIHVYAPTGEPAGAYPMEGGLATSEPMVVTDDGTVYTHAITGRDDDGMRIEYLPHGQEGPGDAAVGPHVRPPEGPWLVATAGNSVSRQNVPFAPRFTWTLAPNGALISGMGDEYRFEVRHRDGLVIVVSRRWRPTPVQPGERAWRTRSITLEMRAVQPDWSWDAAPIPDHKAAYSYFIPAASGEIWVVRPGSGTPIPDCAQNSDDIRERYRRPCWTSQPRMIDAFDVDGRFLGEVLLPEGLRLQPRPHIDGDMVTAMFEDELGIIRVKRLRLNPLASG